VLIGGITLMDAAFATRMEEDSKDIWNRSGPML
jgi:hypothetical protein